MLKTALELEQKNRELEAQNHSFLDQVKGLQMQFFDVTHKLSAEVKTQAKIIIHQEEKLKLQAQEYEKLLQYLLDLRRIQFGSKSERFVDSENQIPLFPSEAPRKEEQETTPQERTSQEEIKYEDISYKRQKKQGNAESEIPTREEIIPVMDKTCSCGAERKVIDYETKRILNYVPAIFEIIVQKREVVACNHCQNGMETAPVPLQLLPKCKASESLLAHIAVSKILDRQPLYHLEKKIERDFHWIIPRNTLARWMITMADGLTPLVNAFKETLSHYDVASADATTLQVLDEPDRKAEQKSFAYCIRGGPPGKEVIIFDYLESNHKDYLSSVFLDFKGTIHTDGANCYENLAQRPDVQLSLCHAHARRRFEQVFKASSKKKDGLAKHALSVYRQLYAIERFATEKSLSPEQRQELRQAKTKPLLQDFKTWLDYHAELVLPKSPIGKAIAYTRNHWEGLLTFLSDGRLSPDNNATEREIKTFVIARKNFLFSQSVSGADALGTLFSIFLTAKHHNLNPKAYFETILKLAPACSSFDDWIPLLPWNLTNPQVSRSHPLVNSPG